jgi:hypothetical protein
VAGLIADEAVVGISELALDTLFFFAVVLGDGWARWIVCWLRADDFKEGDNAGNVGD